MKRLPPCVFPSLSEQDVITVPGIEPCTAYRLRVEPGDHGYLRIEQLGYNQSMGWYTQKTFCLPGEVVHQLMPHLKQAAALLPLPGREEISRAAIAGRMSQATFAKVAAKASAEVSGEDTSAGGPLRFPGPCVGHDDHPGSRLRKI